MDAQWAGIIGTSAGVVLGSAGNWINQRWAGRRDDDQQARQDARQDRQRWHERRLDAYVMAWLKLSAVQEAFDVSARAAAKVLQSPRTPRVVKRELAAADVALREGMDALTVLRFIARPEGVQAADRCADVLVEMIEARTDSKTPAERIDELLSKMNAARHALVAQARIELDVDVGDQAHRPIEPHPGQ